MGECDGLDESWMNGETLSGQTFFKINESSSISLLSAQKRDRRRLRVTKKNSRIVGPGSFYWETFNTANDDMGGL